MAGRTLVLVTGFWLVLCSGTMTAAADNFLKQVSFADLSRWSDDNHASAFQAFALSCREIIDTGASFKRSTRYAGRRTDWLEVCRLALRGRDKSDRTAARNFFEDNFVPVRISDSKDPDGLFTGYYEPRIAGSRKRTPVFNVPLYARPADLVTFDAAARKATGLRYGRMVSGKPRRYFTRRQIEEGALSGKGLEVAWVKSWADAFFLQVQGSGTLRLPDGTAMRVGFAGKTGLPYTAIGAVLIKQGEVAREDMSMQAIRDWMDKNPAGSRTLMWHNESFVFFRELKLEDPNLGPLGAQQVQLTPLRSLAVDRRFWVLGTPMWLETRLPQAAGNDAIFHHLMIAQDTGTAIRNRIRGDIFFGPGEDAAALAGHMQSPGRLYALLPKPLARRLGIGK